MHDPMTVAFDVGRIFTIWHVDPETDGADNSCGWFTPKQTPEDQEIIRKMVEWDMQHPFYSALPVVQNVIIEDPDYPDLYTVPVGDCIGYVAAAWETIAWRRDKRMRVDVGEIWEVITLASNAEDNLRASLADEDRAPYYRVEIFLYAVLRAYLRYHRPWYKHPRWHIHHWRIQIHPIQNLKRWLFSRCATCGGRFAFGESPSSTSWNNDGPKWFKSEKYIHHHRCISGRGVPNGTKTSPVVER